MLITNYFLTVGLRRKRKKKFNKNRISCEGKNQAPNKTAQGDSGAYKEKHRVVKRRNNNLSTTL